METVAVERERHGDGGDEQQSFGGSTRPVFWFCESTYFGGSLSDNQQQSFGDLQWCIGRERPVLTKIATVENVESVVGKIVDSGCI